MNILWKKWSVPWVTPAVNRFTALSLTLGSVSISSARPSAMTISVSNILSRNPSAHNSVWICRKNLNRAYLEQWQQWKFQLRCVWGRSFHRLVHVQGRRLSHCQISCPETPLWIFQCDHHVKRVKRTLSHGSNEELDRAVSEVEFIA